VFTIGVCFIKKSQTCENGWGKGEKQLPYWGNPWDNFASC